MQESATSLASPATPDAPCPVAAFINRWNRSGGAELANAQSFLTELCVLLDVLPPDPSVEDIARNAYVFERTVFFPRPDGTASTGRIDCYKRGCFVLETKQGVTRKDEEAAAAWSTPGKKKVGHGLRSAPGWDKVMLRAKNQAEGYVRALPAGEGRPPFLLVVDVGNVIEIFAEFSRTGGVYTPFPDPRSHKIKLEDLHDEAVRQRLQRIWTDPYADSRGWTIVREVLETASGTSQKRPLRGEVLQRPRMRAIDAILVQALELIKARVRSGLENARAKGKRLGRPPVAPARIALGLQLLQQGRTCQQAAEKAGGSITTLRPARRKTAGCRGIAINISGQCSQFASIDTFVGSPPAGSASQPKSPHFG